MLAEARVQQDLRETKTRMVGGSGKSPKGRERKERKSRSRRASMSRATR